MWSWSWLSSSSTPSSWPCGTAEICCCSGRVCESRRDCSISSDCRIGSAIKTLEMEKRGSGATTVISYRLAIAPDRPADEAELLKAKVGDQAAHIIPTVLAAATLTSRDHSHSRNWQQTSQVGRHCRLLIPCRSHAVQWILRRRMLSFQLWTLLMNGRGGREVCRDESFC